MTERDLNKLIDRYQRGLAKPEEVNLLNELQQNNLTELTDCEAVDSLHELDQVKDRVWKHLIKDVDKKDYWFIVIRNVVQHHPYLWAASVLMLFGLSILLFYKTSPNERDYFIYAQNKSTHVDQPITLPDGSRIILKAASSIALSQHFNRSDRQVKLSGSAFFDVFRNPRKPFIIQAGQLVTKVIGTSFSINNSEASREIEVKVYTGKVSVQVNPTIGKTDTPQLLLTPNLKAIFQKDSKTLREALNDNLTVLQPENPVDQQTFNYHEEKLKRVLDQLENAYGIDIILLNEEDGKRLLTGDLGTLSLYQKLNLICSATNLRYEINGSKIILKEAL